MCIRVSDIIDIPLLKRCKLLAGKNGINNIVTGINIYEYRLSKTHDRTGEFYLTSFYNIKEDGKDVLIQHIEILINTNCPGLLLGEGGNVEVNDEVKDLADRNNFPIIYMDENILYSNILESVYKLILGSTPLDNNSILIEKIMNLQDTDIINNHVQRLNPSLKEFYYVFYIGCNSNSNSIYLMLKNLFNYNQQNMIINYKNAIIVIISSDNKKNIPNSALNKITAKLNENSYDYNIGVSELHSYYGNINVAIKCATYAYKVGSKITKRKIEYISDIGMYRMLIPICDNDEVVEYSRNIVNKVKEYDNTYNMEILGTVLMYIECNNDVIKTADRLFIHKNTVRYRLKKVKSIINNSVYDCMEQLAIAIRILKLRDEI